MKNISIHSKNYKNDEIHTKIKLISYKTANIIIHIFMKKHEKLSKISKNIQVLYKILQQMI